MVWTAEPLLFCADYVGLTAKKKTRNGRLKNPFRSAQPLCSSVGTTRLAHRACRSGYHREWSSSKSDYSPPWIQDGLGLHCCTLHYLTPVLYITVSLGLADIRMFRLDPMSRQRRFRISSTQANNTIQILKRYELLQVPLRQTPNYGACKTRELRPSAALKLLQSHIQS